MIPGLMQTVEQEPCQNRKVSALQQVSAAEPGDFAADWRDPRRLLANAANRSPAAGKLSSTAVMAKAAARFMLGPVACERAM